MCWACNPLCGRCKPPQKRAVLCPSCKKMTFFSKSECLDAQRRLCPGCGEDLTEFVHVEPVFCVKCGLSCAYPCKSYGNPATEDGFVCAYRSDPSGASEER